MIDAAVRHLSAKLGNDFSLVQAAGGNVSWKHGDTIYIKASGTWLADALTRDIFVPLTLSSCRAALDSGESSFIPYVQAGSTLRPSIETALHVLLPQSIVVHVHPIDVIAQTVRLDNRKNIANKLADLQWLWIDYEKPGLELAQALKKGLDNAVAIPDVIILANHGLIVAGNSVQAVETLLRDVVNRLAITARATPEFSMRTLSNDWLQHGYEWAAEPAVHALALDRCAHAIAHKHWVLYPDHAVFLGATGVFATTTDKAQSILNDTESPPAIIVDAVGVLTRNDISAACRAMLKCYAEVLLRLQDPDSIQDLSPPQIAELLNWDAEKFRQQLAK